MQNDFEKELRKEFDIKVKTRYGDHRGPTPNWITRRRRRDDCNQYEDPFWEEEDSDNEERREFLYQDSENKPHEMPEIDGMSDLNINI